MILFITTAVKTSNPTWIEAYCTSGYYVNPVFFHCIFVQGLKMRRDSELEHLFLLLTFMLLATSFHAFKGMLEFALLHRITLLNVTSKSACTILNNNYLCIVKVNVHTISYCFLLYVCIVFTPVPSN
jgi:hypothetical protein